MQSPDSTEKTGDPAQPEKTFEAQINALIAKRKLQQEALAKIKASVEGSKPDSRQPSSASSKSTPKPT